MDELEALERRRKIRAEMEKQMPWDYYWRPLIYRWLPIFVGICCFFLVYGIIWYVSRII